MSFINANKKFREGKYEEALALYVELEKRYGKELLAANIESCKTKIIDQPSLGVVPRKNLSFKKKFDDTTRILLDNISKSIDTTERQKLLDKINKNRKFESEPAFAQDVKPIPSEWPNDLKLFPLPESTNDYEWFVGYKKISENIVDNIEKLGLSVIIPTFNRSEILKITLISLLNQKTQYPFEVIVADDGSSEEITKITKQFEDKLDIKFVRQRDYGYQLCAVRNLGIRTAKYEFLAILDCDMAANPLWVESYMQALSNDPHTAYIGPRKYIDTRQLKPEAVYQDAYIFEKLPPVKSDSISTSSEDGISKDWRVAHFEKTDNLRLCNSPFRYFSGGNVAFARKWLDVAGYFDEEFTHWGGEDNEFGYRLYKMGCFFKSLKGALAYHQEPPGKENETDRSAGQAITRKIIEQKVPYFYRKLEPIKTATIKRVPLVSIYIPAYNCQDSIVRCVESALNQTISDLEVCICNDGSTDNTLEVLQANYNNNPRVRFITQKNGGIAKASNKAVKMCRGYYIGQLDSDDYLELDAVELCLKEFLTDKNLACVYTTNRNVDVYGNLISNGYNWPVFSREKFSTAMIVHHFRMFTIRAWNLTSGFDEQIENAVDYDMYLKLSEIGKFKHVNRICYNRVLHGENTSIKKIGIQKNNHFNVVNKALKRQGLSSYEYVPQDTDSNSRKFIFKNNNDTDDIINLNGSYTSSKPVKMPGCLFSIVYPDKPDGILKRVKNILEYNENISGIVFHCNRKFINLDLIRKLSELETDSFKILLNSKISYEKFKYKQIDYHLSNFMLAESEGLKINYFIFDNPDSMFVLPKSYEHMIKYQVGAKPDYISGYWEKKILAHKSLNSFVKKELSTSLNNLKVKSTIHGMFLEYSIAKDVFEVIKEMQEICKRNKDFPEYVAEEVWFHIAICVLEKRKGTYFTKAHTLTYLPWHQKLKWSSQQIKLAKEGHGIANYKFMINSVSY